MYTQPTLPSKRFQDLTGKTFGLLTVISLSEIREAGKAKDKRVLWFCQCECGRTKIVNGQQLRTGDTKSCGCQWRTGKHSITHGHTIGKRTKEYSTWARMIARCENPSSERVARRYRDRGIKVCNRWRCSFEAFFDDMGPRPSDRHSIDRIDNDGNYEPSNCRWATRSEQGRNTTRNRLITCRGQTKTLAEWAEISGVSCDVIRQRIDRDSWDSEKAIFYPTRKFTRNGVTDPS